MKEDSTLRRLHYFAKEIWPGHQVQHTFTCAVDAEEGARILAKLAPGAVAYQQWGDLEADIWEDPDPLVITGDVPEFFFAIDPSGRDPWLDDVA